MLLSACRRLSLVLALGAAAWLAGCAGAPPVPPPPVAREPIPPKVGLALGGGGARGFAHVGVLRVLEQERIPVDLVVGTSVGSLIGALYADTRSVMDLEFAAHAITSEDVFDYGALTFLSGGFIKGEKLQAFLGRNLKNKTIETLTMPFAAVAVDLRTGETVVLDKGPVAKAVHASAAIPGVFVPVELGGRTLVDGGCTDPVPAAVARRKGAEVVIAVPIAQAVPKTAPKNPLTIAYQAVSIMSAEITRWRASEADVVIAPEVGDVAFDDFTQKRRLIQAGADAARAALPAIRAAIAAKTRAAP